MKKLIMFAVCSAVQCAAVAAAHPVPREALVQRMQNGPDVIGIVHWGLNTYTDKEWGFGDADPALLNPLCFDAGQIVEAAKAGGIGGLVVVAKHHDGFCLWPTATTDYNITKSPFWKGPGRDYVREMAEACRMAGLKFGVYVSPWDRHDADYATEKYVETYHAQVKELAGGAYGDMFELWFDGANGGDGWYGGANENRTIGRDYYRFADVFRFVRDSQPNCCIFAEDDDSDFRYPGNENGMLSPDSRATVVSCGGLDDNKFLNPLYPAQKNTGSIDGDRFRVCESDFPLRRGWFWHESEKGTTKSPAHLAKIYLNTVGNGGTMNIGLAPDKTGRICDDDAAALAGFKAMRDALFANEVVTGKYNVVVMREDIAKGERIVAWRLLDGENELLRGASIGAKRIRILREEHSVDTARLETTGGEASISFYLADPELVGIVEL